MVIDSLGLALGGVVNEAETVVRLFEAVRELDATTLLIDHQGKGEDADRRGAIGSSYKRHYARSECEMRRSDDGDTLIMGLYPHKANNAKKAPLRFGPRHRNRRPRAGSVCDVHDDRSDRRP